VTDPLDPTFLINIITNGRTHQPGDPEVPPQSCRRKVATPISPNRTSKDLAAYIIEQNRIPGGGPLPPGELAKRTMLWSASDRLHDLRHLPARAVQHAVDRASRRGATEVTAEPADAINTKAPPLSPIPAGGSPRVLIVFSDTGGGHRAAAAPSPTR